MQIRLLGPVDVTVGGVPRTVSGLRRRAVLAVLALRVGEVVSTDQLAEVIWDGRPPATPLNTLQSHISYLRRELRLGDAIVTRPSGYLLRDTGEVTDLQVAEALIQQGKRQPDSAESVAHLRAALTLWRGRSFADLAGLAWFDQKAEQVNRVRRAAIHSLTEAQLALGEHGQLVPELQALAEQFPYDEEFHRQLILALYRTGRQTDALATYQLLRARLHDELGIDPGRSLRDMESAILRQDDALEVAAAPTAPPAQLPPTTATFVGREKYLTQLNQLLSRVPPRDRAADAASPVIAVITGTAGAGKTTLATHWAHSASQHFPDGQLYVNLRGFDTNESAMDPTKAIHGFLQAVGLSPQTIPLELPALINTYRSVLARKRLLIVIDNARDAEQVRPLLPNARGCLVLVTSRNQLRPLIAVEGVENLSLGLLSADDARALLTRRLGKVRVLEETDAVNDLVTRCVGLPLALSIVAAHATVEPDRQLSDLASQMGDSSGALDLLTAGDPATDARAVFSWSYQTLSPDAARLFRLLGACSGPAVSVQAAASLAGSPPQAVQSLLAELNSVHMLMRNQHGRYTFHDLLRAYAAEQARALETAHDLQQALRRILDHYLHTALAARLDLQLDACPIPPDPPVDGVTLGRLDGGGTEWFATERESLVYVVRQGYAASFDTHTWQLAWALTTFTSRRGYLSDQASVNRIALSAATRLRHVSAQAHALRSIAVAEAHLGATIEADAKFRQAIDMLRDDDEPALKAILLLNFAKLLGHNDRSDEALQHAQHALTLYRSAGDQDGEAHALNAVGWHSARLGQLDAAFAHCLPALRLFEELDDLEGQAVTIDSIGYVRHQRNDYQQAIDDYKLSLELHRKAGYRINAADTLEHLGDAYNAAGNPDLAVGAWQQAATTLRGFNHPSLDRIQAKLNDETRLARRVAIP